MYDTVDSFVNINDFVRDNMVAVIVQAEKDSCMVTEMTSEQDFEIRENFKLFKRN